jgi:hypothetical protein
MNAAYGSELHLLRMLGRHRDFFNRKLCNVTAADDVEWLDFPSGEMRRDSQQLPRWDREWHHLEFLPSDDAARLAWQIAWPTHRPGHKWDAIGRLRYGKTTEWLLVEAKANLQELSSDCQAKDSESLKLIRGTLIRTKAALGVDEACDWMTGYYQVCNRLAALHTLNSNGAPARMLFLYFCGDESAGGRICPASSSEWDAELEKVARHVGLFGTHILEKRVHKAFIDVRCNR